MACRAGSAFVMTSHGISCSTAGVGPGEAGRARTDGEAPTVLQEAQGDLRARGGHLEHLEHLDTAVQQGAAEKLGHAPTRSVEGSPLRRRQAGSSATLRQATLLRSLAICAALLDRRRTGPASAGGLLCLLAASSRRRGTPRSGRRPLSLCAP